MAKKPGAGGVILVAVVCGLLTCFFVYKYLQTQAEKSRANWDHVVVATQDIPPRTKVARDMVSLTEYPRDRIVPMAVTNINDVVNHLTLERVKSGDQVRLSDLAKNNQLPGLSYKIPAGKRAITIAVDEIKGVGATVNPGDNVDILATYTDPVARQETTQMILQNVPVLAVDKGKTEAQRQPAQGQPVPEGATTSITLAVSPEETELVAAADRAGVLRVSLRPAEDKTIVASQGMRVSEILRGKYNIEPLGPSNAEVRATPIIISPPPPPREKPELKIIRGVQETTIRVD